VRALLAPYQTINPLGLKKSQWEQLVLGMDWHMHQSGLHIFLCGQP
jgi:hypothetical protein